MDSGPARLLKHDLFGTVELDENAGVIRRDTRAARWWVRSISRHLAAREARVLRALADVPGIPRLIRWDGQVLERSYLAGLPMQEARPRRGEYFRAARVLLCALHRHNVVHNDLAKEPNWLVLSDGTPGLIDFQLAAVSRRRGRWFRLLAREDLRHFLKHKRTYLPERLSARERRLLAQRAWTSRLWMGSVKPVYLFVTRRLLNWSDREGAGDRGSR